MKLKLSFKKIILVLLIVCAYYFINANKSYAYTYHTLQEAFDWATSKAWSNWYGDIDGVNGCQCVDLIYAYYDYLVGYHPGGNAADFAYNELPSGWTRVSNPTPGDIVVWGPYAKFGWDNPYIGSDSNYGHIGIVYAVTDYGSIWTVETNAQLGRTIEEIYTYGGAADDYERNPSQVACYIHPDFYDQTPTKPNIPSNMLNLGDSFYAYMMMSNNWDLFNVDVNDNVVLQQGVWQDKKQIWNFIRQTDGSYVIKNVNTGKYLDVYNSNDYDGGIIRTFTYNGSNAQKYFLYGSQDKCVIRPACSTTRVVSVDGGINAVGQKLNMWEYWEVETQLFYIWKVDEAKASTLNYSINEGKVTLNWTKGENADKYNIIIKSGTPGKVKEYKKITDIVGTSYNITLPAGYYEVVVEGWNYFSNAFSNTIKFTNGSTQIDIKPYIDNSGVIFDAKYYLNKYPDLKKAYGTDETKAYNHFVTKGIKEGRQGSRVFNVKYYLEKNADVKKAYGNNYSKALRHFATNGMKERRIASSEFNVKLYIANYTDLQKAYGMNYKKYYAHFETKGYKEKRIATKLISKKLTDIDKCVFDAKYYLAKYPDVKKAYGNDYTKAYNHFITNGLSEGRQGSRYFNVKYYLGKYPDLKKTYGNDYIKAYNHFKTNGLKEGRRGSNEFNVKAYQANYADLRKAFGNNYLKYYLHYMNNGIKENRKAI